MHRHNRMLMHNALYRKRSLVNVNVVKPRELSPELVHAWCRFLNDDPALYSPYFRPEFTMMVANVRDDVEVAVIEEGNEVIGFFPFQRRPGNLGKPVGGRLSDFQGIIGRADGIASAPLLMRTCGLAAWDFDHLLASQTLFAPYIRECERIACIDISKGWDAYVQCKRDTRSDLSPTAHRSFRGLERRSKQKYRKLEREIGPVRFEMDATDEDLFKQVIEWKSQQYRRTNVTDVFARDWTTDLLKQILGFRTEAFSGMLSALYAGDRVIAIHMGMRSRNVLHCWFPAHDVSMGQYSPGNQLFFEMIKAAHQLGIVRIDLGKAVDWKASFMNCTIPVVEGSVDLRPVRRRLRNAWRNAHARLRVSPLRTPLKLPARVAYRIKEWIEFQ
jgi:CelD/BcsL family acetyltransferase involved in cellulose biosynthesis